MEEKKNLVICAEHLTYAYEDDGDTQDAPPAVNDVSFSIAKGEYVAILGHNGSGKSTLAKLCNMILTPTDGKLFVLGKDVTSENFSEEDMYDLRSEIGMVFQNPDNQIVATVVEEDVAFGCENLGLPPAEIRRRVDEALDIVGMKKYARHATHKLSGGQKQRIAIAGTIAMKRKCIIFDESTAMLDPLGRREVMATIERLNREEGITVLLITHYMNEAAMADHIVVMSEGKVLTRGTPDQVFGDPELLWSAELDVPQTTELLYKMRQAGLDVPLNIFDPEECAAVIADAIGKAREKMGK